MLNGRLIICNSEPFDHLARSHLLDKVSAGGYESVEVMLEVGANP